MIKSFMEKARTVASLIKSDSDNEFIEELQETVEAIYTILYIFIYNNNKHKLMIEEDIEILLFPIKIKKIMNYNKSNSIRKCISKFILEYTTDFVINELSDKKKFIDIIHELIKETDIKKDHRCTGYYIEILKIIIMKSTSQIDEKIFFCFDYLKKTY